MAVVHIIPVLGMGIRQMRMTSKAEPMKVLIFYSCVKFESYVFITFLYMIALQCLIGKEEIVKA